MIRTFLVNRVMNPRITAKTRPTMVPPMLTMRNEAAPGEEGSVKSCPKRDQTIYLCSVSHRRLWSNPPSERSLLQPPQKKCRLCTEPTNGNNVLLKTYSVDGLYKAVQFPVINIGNNTLKMNIFNKKTTKLCDSTLWLLYSFFYNRHSNVVFKPSPKQPTAC